MVTGEDMAVMAIITTDTATAMATGTITGTKMHGQDKPDMPAFFTLIHTV